MLCGDELAANNILLILIRSFRCTYINLTVSIVLGVRFGIVLLQLCPQILSTRQLRLPAEAFPHHNRQGNNETKDARLRLKTRCQI